ncbi:MAG: hypothetical protein R2715_12310 [Ilumatobacteraceae bacterium]
MADWVTSEAASTDWMTVSTRERPLRTAEARVREAADAAATAR